MKTSTQAQREDYDGFVEKFKNKKTTDDCMTPPAVYEIVSDYVRDAYGKDPAKFVRPFWPGGDYEHFDYPDGCVVVDNPPFSVLKKIVTFYGERGIPYFLFCGTLTAGGLLRENSEACVIVAAASVVYENGAEVNTSFVTNLPDRCVIRTEPALRDRIEAAQPKPPELPQYTYPHHVVSAAGLARLTKHGIRYGVQKGEARFIRRLDSQIEQKKEIYGGGLIISDQAAARLAAADEAARADAAAALERRTIWQLSDRERELISTLSKEGTA